MRIDSATHQRDIGPIGTAGRIVTGAAAVAVPIAVEGAGWWDIATGLIAFPLLSTGVAWLMSPTDRRAGALPPACRDGLCSTRGCALFAVMIGTTVALGVLTPVEGDVAFWLWLGASMLLGAARGYGGCEALAFFNALTGRRDQIGCLLFTPIDAAEARHRAATRTTVRGPSPEHPRGGVS